MLDFSSVWLEQCSRNLNKAIVKNLLVLTADCKGKPFVYLFLAGIHKD